MAFVLAVTGPLPPKEEEPLRDPRFEEVGENHVSVQIETQRSDEKECSMTVRILA